MKIFIILSVFGISILGQSINIVGTVKDSTTNKPLQYANIFIEELGEGTTTDINGNFKFVNIKPNKYTLKISYIGYEPLIIGRVISENTEMEILLVQSTIKLKNLLVEGTNSEYRKTSIAFSKVKVKDIEFRTDSKSIVNLVRNTPSSFVSSMGGGIGEQRLSLRGFDQTNISVMINGIPINNPENGEIYWSNWAGMSDIIGEVQVQRGLSEVPYSTSSIGGTVNFLTRSNITNDRIVKIKSEIASENTFKTSLNFSTKISDVLHLNGLISRRVSDGYADQVYSHEFTYFVSLAMLLNNHSFELNVFGSPQDHGQRLTPQRISVWKKYGRRYNFDWGYLKGNPLNLRDNEFHNPTINLKHNWQINEKIILSTIYTFSHGEGGGTVPPFFPPLPRTDKNLIDFDSIWELNTNNIDPNFVSNKSQSQIALRKGIHNNYWNTLITVLNYKYDKFSFNIGFNGKLYSAQNFNEISDLLGGDYTIGNANVNDDPNRLLYIGDKVDFNADSFTRSYGSFVKIDFEDKNLSAFANLALSRTGYNRIDYFNYLVSDPKRETGWKYFTSTTFKAGANFNIDSHNNVYFNLGNFSKAPLSQNVYDYSNNEYGNIKNEEILSFEVGYGFTNEFMQLGLNAYTTYWDDKAFSNSYLNSDSTAIYYYNIFGASAVHSGLELDSRIKFINEFSARVLLSYSVNKWTSDVDAYIRPESNPLDIIRFSAFTENLYVGNYPMNIAMLELMYSNSLNENLTYKVIPTLNFYGRYYSNFNPETRTDEDEKNIQPWRIPDFYNVNLHIGFEYISDFKFFESFRIGLNIFNVLNQHNIIEAVDGSGHNSETANVWYNRDRWWSTTFEIHF